MLGRLCPGAGGLRWAENGPLPGWLAISGSLAGWSPPLGGAGHPSWLSWAVLSLAGSSPPWLDHLLAVLVGWPSPCLSVPFLGWLASFLCKCTPPWLEGPFLSWVSPPGWVVLPGGNVATCLAVRYTPLAGWFPPWWVGSLCGCVTCSLAGWSLPAWPSEASLCWHSSWLSPTLLAILFFPGRRSWLLLPLSGLPSGFFPGLFSPGGLIRPL